MNTIKSLLLALVKPVYAHCDTLDGPVVSAARNALRDRDVNKALIWVRPEDEASITQSFDKALQNRDAAADEAAKSQADYSFFEHLVKVHREGEDEEYEGLKPAGAAEDEQLADRAVVSGNLDEILPQVSSDHSKHILTHLFHKLREKADYRTDDLPAGRNYVAAYAHFIHSVGPAISGKDLDEHAAHHHGH